MDCHEKPYIEERDDDSDVSLLRGSEDGQSPKRSPQKPYVTILKYVLAAFIGGLAASTIWAAFWPLRSCPVPLSTAEPENEVSPVLQCGSTPAEARANGCKLQTWSYTWVPEPCFDPELAEEFIAIHEKDDLPYYADRNGTEVVDFDTVYTGELEVLYTVWGSHFWHCAFLMRKFYRGQAGLTVASLDYEHVEHCQMWLTDPFRYDWRRVNTKAVLYYGSCDANGFEIFAGENFETIEQE